MFSNIGKKIKTLAVVLFIIMLIGVFAVGLIVMIRGTSVIPGVNRRDMFFANTASVLVGIVIWCFGFLLSWIGSFFLYGFGELIDKTAENAKYTRRISDFLESQRILATGKLYNQNNTVTQENVQKADDATAQEKSTCACPNCGTENDDSFCYCTFCGNKLK